MDGNRPSAELTRSTALGAGDHCEIPAGCMHTTKVGPEGVAYIAGKAYRRASAN